ncbi:hypothetical protein VTL71DRAFT_12528 [Oculimacula yallundae]|uniref:Uncharacterized protein n=1 Tax=Oculimacula yallundae TaxID=86028 RepID=A0ABR4CNK8_9HELO
MHALTSRTSPLEILGTPPYIFLPSPPSTAHLPACTKPKPKTLPTDRLQCIPSSPSLHTYNPFPSLPFLQHQQLHIHHHSTPFWSTSLVRTTDLFDFYLSQYHSFGELEPSHPSAILLSSHHHTTPHHTTYTLYAPRYQSSFHLQDIQEPAATVSDPSTDSRPTFNEETLGIESRIRA